LGGAHGAKPKKKGDNPKKIVVPLRKNTVWVFAGISTNNSKGGGFALEILDGGLTTPSCPQDNKGNTSDKRGGLRTCGDRGSKGECRIVRVSKE